MKNKKVKKVKVFEWINVPIFENDDSEEIEIQDEFNDDESVYKDAENIEEVESDETEENKTE